MFTKNGPSFAELVRQGLSSTDGGYDLLAPKFDHTPFRTPDDVTLGLRPIFDEAPVSRALDLCTGTGAAAEALGWVASDRVVGIDRSIGMLEQARATFADRTGARGAAFAFHQRDALLPPLPYSEGASAHHRDLGAGSFDLVTCFGAFGHIEKDDEARLASSIFRYLAPGGRFVFVTAEHPPWLSLGHLQARAFNTAMHVRNAVWRPRFVMFYLTFLLPRAFELLTAAGFNVDVRRNYFPKYPSLVVVVATRASTPPSQPQARKVGDVEVDS